MRRGLIIYNSDDYQKNVWFVNKCIDECAKREITLTYIEERDVFQYLMNNSVDFVIYRGRNSEITKRIQEQGVVCFNNFKTNHIANNKLLTYEMLLENSIKCLKSYSEMNDVKDYPCIMKSVNGHGGQEVFLINSKNDAKAIINKYSGPFIYQEFYKNDGDVRLYLIDKKVVAGVLRKNKNDFRNNYSLGGEVSLYIPSLEMKETAIKIATILDSCFIGVDFLIKGDAFLVNEIEDPVGSRMLYQTSDLDIIKLFIECIEKKLNDK